MLRPFPSLVVWSKIQDCQSDVEIKLASDIPLVIQHWDQMSVAATLRPWGTDKGWSRNREVVTLMMDGRRNDVILDPDEDALNAS